MPSLFTTAVHAGRLEPKPGAPSAPPIVTASGWSYDDMRALDAALGDAQAGYVYSRNAAPTQEAIEPALHAALLAAIEPAPGMGDRCAGLVACVAV